MRIRSTATRSDPGSHRRANEDAVLADPQVPIYAVADGTGGPGVAELVTDRLRREADRLRPHAQRVQDDCSTASRLAIGQYFEEVFETISSALRDEGERRETKGLAASLVAATVLDRFAELLKPRAREGTIRAAAIVLHHANRDMMEVRLRATDYAGDVQVPFAIARGGLLKRKRRLTLGEFTLSAAENEIF